MASGLALKSRNAFLLDAYMASCPSQSSSFFLNCGRSSISRCLSGASMGAEPGVFLSAGAPIVISHSTGGTLKSLINSSRVRASTTPHTAAIPANRGTSGSHPTVCPISSARRAMTAGHREMSIIGGRGRRSTMTDFGSAGAPTAENMVEMSGIGRTHPCCLAM